MDNIEKGLFQKLFNRGGQVLDFSIADFDAFTISYKGLQERHAKLAIGSSVTLVNFLWDSFERKNSKV